MKLFITYLLTFFILINCYAQEKTPNLGTNPPKAINAKDLLQKAAEACLKIKTIEFTEEQFHTDHVDKAPFLTAHVRQARANVPLMGFVPGKFMVEGQMNIQDGKQDKFAYSYDGISFRVLENSEKIVQVVKSPTPYIAGQILSNTGLAGIPQFTQDEPFKMLLEKGENFIYEGTRIVNGVDCDIISFSLTLEHPSFGKRTSTLRWFIGRKDNLPRSNESGGVQKTIKILKTNNASTPTDYFVPILNGYSEKLITGKESKGKGLLTLGTSAPEWTLLDPQGNSHSLSDYRGKIVVLDFWGTWCVPCWKTMPSIQNLHEKFKDRGIAVLGISVADKEGDPAGFMKKRGYTYKLLLNGDDAADLYKAVQLPTLYVIGEDGKIIHAEYGYREDAKTELPIIIEKYLQTRKK